jgi:hypothetical protein
LGQRSWRGRAGTRASCPMRGHHSALPAAGGIGRLSPNGRMQRAHCAGGHGAARPLDVSVRHRGDPQIPVGQCLLSSAVSRPLGVGRAAPRQAPVLPVNASRVQTGFETCG